MDIPKEMKIGRKRSRFQSPNRKIRFDWKAYFNSFCDMHGLFPMEWKGRLLFPDGWTYSISSESGPEYPPPSTELALLELKRQYWILRKQITASELKFRQQALVDVKHAMETHTATLFHTWTTFNSELKTKETHSEAIDIAAMERGVFEIQKDLDECIDMLREYGHEIRLYHLNRSKYAKDSTKHGTGPPEATVGE